MIIKTPFSHFFNMDCYDHGVSDYEYDDYNDDEQAKKYAYTDPWWNTNTLKLWMSRGAPVANHVSQLYLKDVDLPDEIGNLESLSTLDVCDFTAYLPLSVFGFRNLTTLAIVNTPITVVAPEIGLLLNLSVLTISDTHITTLPREIENLLLLTQVDISSNRFSEFPLSLCALPGLESLDVSYNALTMLPVEFSQLTRMHRLNVSNNLFSEFPLPITLLYNLGKLDISDNQLTELPPAIGDLKSLGCLCVDGNSINTLPQEMVKLTHIYSVIARRNPLVDIGKSRDFGMLLVVCVDDYLEDVIRKDDYSFTIIFEPVEEGKADTKPAKSEKSVQ